MPPADSPDIRWVDRRVAQGIIDESDDFLADQAEPFRDDSVDGEDDTGLEPDELAAFYVRLQELLARQDQANGLFDEDKWHRAGAASAVITHMAEGHEPPLSRISRLERLLEETQEPSEVENLEAELTRIHAEFLEEGARVYENGGGGHLPFEGEEEIELPFMGSGRRRSEAAQAAYWPPRDLLRQEHQHAIGTQKAYPKVDLNDLIEWLEMEYGREDEYVLMDDSLADLRGRLPVEIRGCTLSGQGQVYKIESRGPLGGGYTTVFRPQGDHADVFTVIKEGRLGTRDPGGSPPLRHVSVLKELGFRTVGREGGLTYPVS